MKRIKQILNNIGVTLIALLVIAGLIGIGYLNFHAWKVCHPEAPTWAYFFTHH